MRIQFKPDDRTRSKYYDLTIERVYNVIGIEADDFRIMNDNGRPYLYPKEIFVVVSTEEPNEWMSEYGEGGERYAYPPELARPGFFEDYFDGDNEAKAVFESYYADIQE